MNLSLGSPKTALLLFSYIFIFCACSEDTKENNDVPNDEVNNGSDTSSDKGTAGEDTGDGDNDEDTRHIPDDNDTDGNSDDNDEIPQESDDTNSIDTDGGDDGNSNNDNQDDSEDSDDAESDESDAEEDSEENSSDISESETDNEPDTMSDSEDEGSSDDSDGGDSSQDTGTATDGEGSDTGTGFDTEPKDAPTISNLTIENNPNSVLSCYVSWSTDTIANSEVQFGIDGYQFKIVDNEEVTDHRVLVIGMYAESAYQIKAVSTNITGADSAEDTYTTGSLPMEVPVAELTVDNLNASQGGWTLTNITWGSGFGSGAPPAVIVMYDEYGIPVWYFIDGTEPDTRGDIDAKLLPNNNVLVGAIASYPPVEVDLGGNVVWTGPDQSGSYMSGTPMTHHVDKLPNGNYLLLRDYTSDEYSVTGTLLEEITPEHDVVWSWNLFDHMTPDEEAERDWCHGNSVTINNDEGTFYLSCRNMGLILKAHLDGDQSIIWTLGEEGDFDIDPPTETAWFADLHDPEIHDDGTILLYDNGGFDMTGDDGLKSRVLEYDVDEENMLATLVWEFPGDFDVDAWYSEVWYTEIWGDSDRLENGNVLITAGTRNRDDNTRIFEVAKDTGEVVWEITLPQREERAYGSYRAQRLSPPPLVQPL